jgi:protein-S-isoprenylcysteine O-methyltransferase Ste14
VLEFAAHAEDGGAATPAIRSKKLSMKASDWEFKQRATIFGLIFGLPGILYTVDHQNITAAVANWLEPLLHRDAETLARVLFAVAAGVVALGALVRTWASAYLNSSVVYASEVKTAALVADGPYRRVRNPLYFGNVLMVIGIGSMMSRAGFVLAFVSMLVFCYRLIFREEADLLASQGESFAAYLRAVPRLFPSPWPRTAPAGGVARWADGFRAESWCWGFAVALAAFAVTLKMVVFVAILGASIALFYVSSSAFQEKTHTGL